jgi:hypothetical protein
MQDDQFDSWIRDNGRSSNDPPPPDIEGMWATIEQQHFATRSVRRPWVAVGWLKVAAALLLGVGLGRVSLPATRTTTTVPSRAVSAGASLPPLHGAYDALPALNAPDANKYLGETVALLASLQSDRSGSETNRHLVSGAADLLNTTRFLLDAPTTTDPSVRGLLEDLELVLAQIVQMPKNGSNADVESIHQAMEQRDVMPRLRTAVANNYSTE